MPHTLIPEQQAIVDFMRDSTTSLIVKAGAGCAKTSTLEAGAPGIPLRPGVKGLALAFNTHIKKELEKRLPATFDVLTMNGLGHRAWGNFLSKRLELDDRKINGLIRRAFSVGGINDETGDYYTLIKGLVDGARTYGLVPNGAPGRPKPFMADDLDSWLDIADAQDLIWPRGPEGQFVEPDEHISLARDVLLASIHMAFAGTIDFNDQIYMSCCFGGAFRPYPVVIADEAQDFSVLNHFMLKRVANGRFIGVGDPHQSIYGFRGAHGNSMELIQAQHQCEVLTLPVSFRCSQAVVKNVNNHVPWLRAFHANPQGYVTHRENWTHQDIIDGSAILCRNNGPLLDLAFKLINHGRNVRFIKTEIGKFIIKLVEKIADGDKTLKRERFHELADLWYLNERARYEQTNSRRQLDRAADRRDCIMAAPGDDVGAIIKNLEAVFNNTTAPIVLGTAHGAKGLEYDHVYHLDSWLIPSRFAETEQALEQENNIRYVLETRARIGLTYIDLEKFVRI